MIVRGLRTLALILTGLCAFTAVGSLIIGTAAGMPAQRALSGGFMLVGSVLFTAGAVAGLRDPGRAQRERRLARGGPATWTEAFHLSVVLVGLGLCLVLLGVVLNPRSAL